MYNAAFVFSESIKCKYNLFLEYAVTTYICKYSLYTNYGHILINFPIVCDV